MMRGFTYPRCRSFVDTVLGDGVNVVAGAQELEGAAAIVTGSTGNLGRTIAMSLANAGAMVLINAKTSADAAKAVVDEIEAGGGRAIMHMADVTVAEDVEGMVKAAVDAFGRLDILVNNVGIPLSRPITETSFEEWRMVLAGTLDAAFFAIRAAVPHLAKNGQGAVVSIGASSAHAGIPNRSAVAAAKAGLAAMMASLAVELAPQDISVNCVAPGNIQRPSEPGRRTAHFRERPVPLGRAARPQEVAAMVRLLCGPEGRYTTGQTIHVNGGWHVSIG